MNNLYKLRQHRRKPVTHRWDSIWIDVHLATMAPDGPAYGAIPDGALGIKDGRIVHVGRRDALPAAPQDLAEVVHSGGGCWLTPGLIDCHTHLVYAGNRANEFEMRLNGASYEEIARAGGGIVATVRATRAADEPHLVAESLPRLDSLLAEGVTTVEIKSGYGLDTEAELRILRAARRLASLRPVQVSPTFLGAHAVPPEAKADPEAYVTRVCDEMIPRVAAGGLAEAVDAFCEGIGFSPAQTRRVFEAARRHGLAVKLHAEQLSNLGGAALVAEFGGLSADHVEHLDEAGAAAMAEAGTVAVLLPGAFYFLRETRKPPVAMLRRHCVAMAVATDCNPGTSPATSLLLMLNMACTLFGLTPEEALAGVTREAARALGKADRGMLAPGLRADLALWHIGAPAELAYAIGFNPCAAVVNGGRRREPR